MRWNAPSGIVSHDTGHVIYDTGGTVTFIVGPHQHLINGQQQFCDAFGVEQLLFGTQSSARPS